MVEIGTHEKPCRRRKVDAYKKNPTFRTTVDFFFLFLFFYILVIALMLFFVCVLQQL